MFGYFDQEKQLEYMRREERAEGRAEGLAEGRISGEKNRSLDIARRMKAKGYSDIDIAEMTGLSLEEISAF